MSISELTKLISPGFSEETVFKILKTKSDLLDLKVLDIVIDKDAAKKGDSYLSTICRFTVRASGRNRSGDSQEFTVPVIVKCFPKNVARHKTFRSADFFKTEIYFYDKVWPEMKKIKLSKKLPDTFDEVPLVLATYSDGKTDFIALEDLSYQGFKCSGRNDVITRESLSLLLKVLANFHALGLVAKMKNPEFEKIAKGIPESYFADKYRSWYENFMYKSMGPQLQKAVDGILPQEYYDKLTELFSGDLYKRFIEGCNIHNKFSTITEGDSWLPNFLIQSDKDGIKLNAILIDFQLARFAPLTNDLLHFLYSAVPKQFLLKDWDNLIAEYHQHLSTRIEALGGDKDYITLKELQQGLKKFAIVGIGMAMESVTMSLLTDDEVADLDFLEGEEAYALEDVWILPKYDRTRNERLAFLIKHAVDKGFIP